MRWSRPTSWGLSPKVEIPERSQGLGRCKSILVTHRGGSSWSTSCRSQLQVGYAAGSCLLLHEPYRCSAIGRCGPASPGAESVVLDPSILSKDTYGGPGIQNNTISPCETNLLSIASQGRQRQTAKGDCVHFPIGDGEALALRRRPHAEAMSERSS